MFVSVFFFFFVGVIIKAASVKPARPATTRVVFSYVSRRGSEETDECLHTVSTLFWCAIPSKYQVGVYRESGEFVDVLGIFFVHRRRFRCVSVPTGMAQSADIAARAPSSFYV